MTTVPIRVVAYVDLPYAYPCFANYARKTDSFKRLNCYPGIEIVLIYDQLIALGFQPVFIDAQNETYMKHLLETNAADVAGITTPLQESEQLATTMPLYEDRIIFMVGQPRVKTVPSILFYKCDWLLWLLVVVGLSTCLLYKKFHNYVLRRRFRTVNQSDKAGKLPLIAWSISFLVFSSLFSNNLAITITLQNGALPFADFDAMLKTLETGRCKILLSKSQMHFRNRAKMIEEHVGPKYNWKVIVEALNASIVFEDNDKETLLEKLTGDGCNIGIAWETDIPVWKNMNDGLAFVNFQELAPIAYVYSGSKVFFKKYSTKLSLLNAGSISTLYLNYMAKIAELTRKNRTMAKNANVNVDDDMKQHSLKLYQLKETFYILFFGTAISFVACGFMVVRKKMKEAATKNILCT